MRISAALLAVAAVLALAGCGGDDKTVEFPDRHPVAAADAPPVQAIVGTWRGLVESDTSAEYGAIIAVERAAGQGFRANAIYPGLQCAGKMTGAAERPGVYRFTELITEGKSRCGQTAWDITVDLLRPRQAEWRWSGPGKAFGTLARRSSRAQ
jgi:hypothetical protein